MIEQLADHVGRAITWAQTNTLACLLLGSMGLLLAGLRVLRNRNTGGGT